ERRKASAVSPLTPDQEQRRVMDCSKPPSRAESPAIPLKLLALPAGPTIELTRSGMVLGRHTGADVRLPLPDVSRWHCRFVFVDTAWHIEDLDSLNGVFVNGQRVSRARLQDADKLDIGGFRFEVLLNRSATIATEPTDQPALMDGVAALPMPTQEL